MESLQKHIDLLQGASLMDLVLDQCTDLEQLLALARRETLAAESGEFGELISIVSERATLGERIETYHRQIAELRSTLASGFPIPEAVASASARLAAEIQMLDSRTLTALVSARSQAGASLLQLEARRRNSVSYLSDGRANGLTYDHLA